ncbi:MAG: FAD-dependent oxidoreductase [Steroidobacteraceae bacterium]
MRIAVVGSGIAGNVIAASLHREHDVVVFEARDRPGGHSNTHLVEYQGRQYAVDSGFIVYNEKNYPQFTRLLARIGIATQPSCMSFSVRNERIGLEYCGTNLNSLFAQRRNLLNATFLRMLREILRFNARAPSLLDADAPEVALGEYLAREGYSAYFIEHYVIPMGAAIWSTRPGLMLEFPARFFVRFLHNHGMLSAGKQLAWRSIVGGSQSYVRKLTAPFRQAIRTNCAVERIRRLPDRVLLKCRETDFEIFDRVFLACHSDQALAMLEEPSRAERDVLGAIRFQRNEAVLHLDSSLLPTRRRAWAAWNYHVMPDVAGPVTLTYNMNILQSLPAPTPILVTLNRSDAIDPSRILARETYDHPLFSPDATLAQGRHRELNGHKGTYYCGAWWRNGFHEDGVESALQAVRHFEEDDAKRALHRAG